jgi:hypothetical protein
MRRSAIALLPVQESSNSSSMALIALPSQAGRSPEELRQIAMRPG